MIATRLDRCPQCYYELSGLGERGRCPECGFKYVETMLVFEVVDLNRMRNVGSLPYALLFIAALIWFASAACAIGIAGVTCLLVLARIVARRLAKGEMPHPRSLLLVTDAGMATSTCTRSLRVLPWALLKPVDLEEVRFESAYKVLKILQSNERLWRVRAGPRRNAMAHVLKFVTGYRGTLHRIDCSFASPLARVRWFARVLYYHGVASPLTMKMRGDQDE